MHSVKKPEPEQDLQIIREDSLNELAQMTGSLKFSRKIDWILPKQNYDVKKFVQRHRSFIKPDTSKQFKKRYTMAEEGENSPKNLAKELNKYKSTTY